MTLIAESQYFSPSIFFTTSISIWNMEIDIYESYQKMSFRNRCMIAGAEGPLLLTVPLVGGRTQKKLVREVLIDYKKDWQDNHWKTLVSCYNRSPWFEHFRDALEQLYQTRFQFLYEWNMACLKWTMGSLGLKASIGYTGDYRKDYDPNQYLDLRGQLMPATIGDQFRNPIRYRQVFEERTGFIDHLSVLDLLFCHGRIY